MRSRLISTLFLASVAALVVLVPAGSTAASATAVDGTLAISSFAVGQESFAAVTVTSSEPVARVQLSAPAGYAVRLDQTVGTRLGAVNGTLSEVGATSSPVFVDGDLLVANPASYATDASAQACAPGRHTAVWQTTFSVLGQSFRLPIFADATPNESGATTLVLRFCPAWAVSASVRVSAAQLSFGIQNVLTPPTDQGRYTWSALVAPPASVSVTPDVSRAFELRWVVPHPHTLTLRAAHDAKRRTVVLRGLLTAEGRPEPGREITLGVSTGAGDTSTSMTVGTTNASGEFTIRRRVTQSTQFFAFVEPAIGACSSSSSAPAGCLSETVASPDGASAVVRIRGANEARLAARAQDQARARRIGLKPSDFPAGWVSFDPFPPLFACGGFRPKLSDLTVTGEFESTMGTEQAIAGSRVSLYADEAQARSALRREARLEAARCIANDARSDGATIRQVGAIQFQSLGAETRAFRLVLVDGENVLYIDLVGFRRGRTVVHLLFVGVAEPLSIENELALKVSARASAR